MAKLNQRTFLGRTKVEALGSQRAIYLYDFEWDKDLSQWIVGYVGNHACRHTFQECFMDEPGLNNGHPFGEFVGPRYPNANDTNAFVMDSKLSVLEPIETFLTDVPVEVSKQWWTVKNLYDQFFSYEKAIQLLRSGGLLSPPSSPGEKNPELALSLQGHVTEVVVPQIREVLKFR
jgi:hypothetical protein